VSEKLIIVVRGDLRPGQQLVQAAHALRQFVAEHKPEDEAWYAGFNTMAVVTVTSDSELLELQRRAWDLDVKTSLFCEPDLGNQATAMALEPCANATRICRGLPLALGG